MPWSAAPMAYSLIRPNSQISNVVHDGTLSIRNFILMVNNKLKNSEFEPLSSIGPSSQIQNMRQFHADDEKIDNLEFEPFH
jgi:hypothetical protein